MRRVRNTHRCRFSLGQGKKLWSQPVRFQSGFQTVGAMGIGDLDGDKRPEAIVLEAFDESNKSELMVRVFEGANGNLRWSWKSGFAPSQIAGWQSLVLTDFEGKGIASICVSHEARRFLGSWQRVVVLDAAGKERVRRDLTQTFNIRLTAADLKNDGREKLLIVTSDQDFPEGRLRAWDRELKDLWVWPAPAPKSPLPDSIPADFQERQNRARSVDRIIPASGGRPGAILLTTGVAHDEATGRPVWMSQPALEHRPLSDRSPMLMGPPPQFVPKLLDAGALSRPVLMLATGLGATVCREAMPATAEGTIAPPRGRLAVPGRSIDDPRWTRPLPWRIWLKRGFFGPTAFLVAAGLALLNVILPLFILWLIAGRRRVFRTWALMLLPVAAAVPLVAYPRIVPLAAGRRLAHLCKRGEGILGRHNRRAADCSLHASGLRLPGPAPLPWRPCARSPGPDRVAWCRGWLALARTQIGGGARALRLGRLGARAPARRVHRRGVVAGRLFPAQRLPQAAEKGVTSEAGVSHTASIKSRACSLLRARHPPRFGGSATSKRPLGMVGAASGRFSPVAMCGGSWA